MYNFYRDKKKRLVLVPHEMLMLRVFHIAFI